MRGAARQAVEIGADYHMVCYEDLVSRPEQTMFEVCQFLDIPFLADMTRLDAPIERRGDMDHATRRSSEIVANNSGKFRREMSQAQLLRIEQIVFPFAAELGYQREVVSDQMHIPLALHERAIYAAPHYFGSLHMLVKRWGILRGLRYALSRWRL
jgi:hypothetical protein